MENIRHILGVNVLAARELMKLTQEDLATMANLDVSYLSRVERETVNASIEVVARLAKALRTTTANLLTERR